MKNDKWQLVNNDVQFIKIEEFMDKYNYEDKKMMIDLIERQS